MRCIATFLYITSFFFPDNNSDFGINDIHERQAHVGEGNWRAKKY